MPKWNNPSLYVYHGTDSLSAGAGATPPGTPLTGFTPNLARCRPNTDFGQGFYVTTRLHQAKQWANLKVARMPAYPQPKAVVIRFALDRDWLAGLDSLVFVRPIADFWNLITDCRHGFRPHQRSAPHPSPYDAVYGPVTLWPQKLVIADCDQIGFHTSRAIHGLTGAILYAQRSVF